MATIKYLGTTKTKLTDEIRKMLEAETADKPKPWESERNEKPKPPPKSNDPS